MSTYTIGQDEQLDEELEDPGLWEASSEEGEDCSGMDSDQQWPVHIAGEEVRNGETRYEIVWETWERKDGTNSTWNEEDIQEDDNVLKTWKKESDRRRALQTTISAENGFPPAQQVPAPSEGLQVYHPDHGFIHLALRRGVKDPDSAFVTDYLERPQAPTTAERETSANIGSPAHLASAMKEYGSPPHTRPWLATVRLYQPRDRLGK
ncbi:hypothetical protein MPER_13272 [Moniliophthora perniciosa FA553]|nr:hypothetical protein MPER_13272 [Moniliophthora perniciosa FA553]